MLPIRTGNPGGDMAAIMARVRKMSDAQLADILSGKDVSVPQFAAMTEAMGRKRLRTAMQGQQAQQQAQQPSVKDQLLAEEAGLAALPAPNMSTIDMAGGGIIAFDNGGEVPGYAEGVYVDPLMELSGLGVEGMGTDEARRQALLARRKREEDKERLEFLKTAAPEVAARLAPPAAPVVTPAAPAAAPEKAPATKTETKKDGIAALVDDKEPTTPPEKRDFLGRFEGMGDKLRGDLAKTKDQALGEGLMRAAAGFLSRPTLAGGAAAGLGALAESGAASRKELREAEKAGMDFEFNLAKAREAAAQGNQDLAYKYAALAEQAKYRSGILGIYGQRNQLMKDQYDMVRVPQLLSRIQADAAKQVKDQYGGIVPPSKKAQYEQDVMRIYREKAKAAGLNPDLYSPGTPGLNVLQSLPKGAKELELD